MIKLEGEKGTMVTVTIDVELYTCLTFLVLLSRGHKLDILKHVCHLINNPETDN
mgnify:CR=1 FL=1